MSVRAGIISLLMMVVSGLALAESETHLIKTVRGEITVDADGVVKSVSLNNTKNDELGKFVIERIKSWPFHPMEINGKPVQVTTGFNVNLIATFRPDKKLKQLAFSDLKIQSSALESEDEIEDMSKSGVKHNITGQYKYPDAGVNSGAEATVIVALDLTAEGKVRNAEVQRMWLVSALDKDKAKLADAFRKSALKGAKQGIYREVQLKKYNCSNGCIVSLTVNFDLRNTIANGWKTYLDVPVAPIPWVIASELKSINDEEQSQLVRLKQDPTGKPIEIDG